MTRVQWSIRTRTIEAVSADLLVCRLGTVEYGAALALQQSLRDRVQDGELPDVLLLLDHPPVYTLGRRGGPEDLPLGEDFYRAQGIDVVRSDRGGRLTYHGLGQLVGYPIMRISDVPAFVGAIERGIIAALAREGIAARVREGLRFTGVWVGERKIASIGLHVRRGVTTHGLAINVDNSLEPFEWVVPCGMAEVEMTSVAAETGHDGHFADFQESLADELCAALERAGRDVSPDALGASGLSPVARSD
jgi:lipoyl(octanoyl) transferase